jgi:hypothetical protein
MRRFSFCCIFLLISAAALFAQRNLTRTVPEVIAEQRRVVASYCRSDFEGGRLGPAGWDKMRNFTVASDNPDFDAIFVITRYQVVGAPVPFSKTVAINYIVIGKYEQGTGYTSLSGNKVVNFEVRQRGDSFLVANMDASTPFVSRRAALVWLRKKLESKTTALERNQIQAAISALDTEPAPANAAARP